MKITRKQLRKLILKESKEESVGSFYNTEAGARFDKLLGINNLIDELGEAGTNILRIRDVAKECQSLTLMDDKGGHFGHVADQELFDFFQRMIDLCDEIEPLLDYEKFLGYK